MRGAILMGLLIVSVLTFSYDKGNSDVLVQGTDLRSYRFKITKGGGFSAQVCKNTISK